LVLRSRLGGRAIRLLFAALLSHHSVLLALAHLLAFMRRGAVLIPRSLLATFPMLSSVLFVLPVVGCAG
jgi:hypothetical protein